MRFHGLLAAGTLLAALGVLPKSVAQSAAPAPAAPAEPAGDQTSSHLTKQSQNPGAPLLSVPLQLNFNGNIGSAGRSQTLLNIQPVLPVELSQRFSLVTRWILPLASSPEATLANAATWGVGDLTSQLLFAGNWERVTLGIGPTFIVPTASAESLGQGKLAVGAVLLAVYSQGAWVVGALGAYAASAAGDADRPAIHLLTLQPFINWNLGQGAYLVTAPLITYEAEGDQATVPLGGGVGKLFVMGQTPMNFSVQAFANVAHPDAGPTWQLRFTVQLLFPQSAGKGGKPQ